MGTITFATDTQAALFEQEIKGQISDGAWENSLPYDHYQAWCNAKVKVNPRVIGRDFPVLRTGYNLVKELVTEMDGALNLRMLALARLVKKYGIAPEIHTWDAEEIALGNDPARYDRETLVRSTSTQPMREYAARRVAFFDALPLDEMRVVANDETLYGGNDLLRDLRAISRTMKLGGKWGGMFA